MSKSERLRRRILDALHRDMIPISVFLDHYFGDEWKHKTPYELLDMLRPLHKAGVFKKLVLCSSEDADLDLCEKIGSSWFSFVKIK